MACVENGKHVAAMSFPKLQEFGNLADVS